MEVTKSTSAIHLLARDGGWVLLVWFWEVSKSKSSTEFISTIGVIIDTQVFAQRLLVLVLLETVLDFLGCPILNLVVLDRICGQKWT